MSTADPVELDAAYRRWLPFVRRAVTRLRVSPEDVEDVSQEVFIVMLRKLPLRSGLGIADPDNVRGWLYETARRVAHNHKRGRGRHDRKVAVARAIAQSADEHRRSWHEPLVRLQRVIGELSPAERVAFELAVVQGHPGREVATALGIKLHAAYALIADVRQRVDDALVTGERRPKLASVVFGWFRGVLTQGRLIGLDRVALPAAALGVVLVVGNPPSVPMDTVSVPEPSPADVRHAVMTAAQPTPWEPDIVILDDDEPDMVIVDDDPPLARAHGVRLADQPAGPDEFLAALEAFEPNARIVAEPATELFPSPAPKQPDPLVAPPESTPDDGYWHGRFVRDDGTPMAHAGIRCRRRTDTGTRKRCFPRGQGVPRTDARGRVTVGPLSEGVYELTPFESGAIAAANQTIVVSVN